MRKPMNYFTQDTYEGIDYIIVFEGAFSYTVIAEGKEVCNSTSCERARDKFKALIDTGLTI